jgi:DNA-binding NtrC family response regulator
MSAASTRLVPKGSDQEREKSRSPIAHLLHALNQPLTGLQCSLELASVGIRRRDEYVQTLRESLELVSRMRILVEALRELADSGETGVCNVETFPLDELVREITEDLLPVAQSQGSEISVNIAAPLPVRADRRRLAALMFRFLESLLSMTRAGANLEIEAGGAEQAGLFVRILGKAQSSGAFAVLPSGTGAARCPGRLGTRRCEVDRALRRDHTHLHRSATPCFGKQFRIEDWRVEMSALPAMPSFHEFGGALIASPDGALREQVLHRLNGRCRPIQQVLGGADALAKLEKGDWQVLFLDRRLPDLDADELRAIIQRRFPGITVVLLDSDGGKPRDDDAITDEPVTFAPIKAPKVAEIASVNPLPGMIGSSTAIQRVYRMVRLVASRTTTVLVTGPTGTGKELVARGLHALSPRSSKPLVVVNCAAIPETLLESELFGYTRGAFTGAIQPQIGRISAAHGGTLFLDEISELPLGMQAKLLRFLEQKEVQRLGASEVTRVDVRVVAASNADLAARAERGEFRQDLFYRLSAFPIDLPPLIERREDIVPQAKHFLSCMAAALGLAPPYLSDEAIRILEAHSWTGNVRELQHVLERASILVESADTIEAEHLYFAYKMPEGNSRSLV